MAPVSQKRTLRSVVFILVSTLTLSLTACPFSYDLPLSSPAEAVQDVALVGNWKAQDPESGQWVTMEFLRYNEREYVAWTREGGDGTTEIYRVFVTEIDGERFLNAQELGAGNSPTWNYVNYRVSGDTLFIRFVDEAIFSSKSFESSEALREFVRRNLHDPRLYMSDDGKESVMTWQRVKT